jgi:hypothetical protein
MLVMLFSASALCRTAHCMVPLRLSTWPSARPTSRGDTCPERARAAQQRPGCSTARRDESPGGAGAAVTRARCTTPLRLADRPIAGPAGPAGRGDARLGRERACGAAARWQLQTHRAERARWRRVSARVTARQSGRGSGVRPSTQSHRAGSHNRTKYAVTDSDSSSGAGAEHERRRRAPSSRWPWPGCSRR